MIIYGKIYVVPVLSVHFDDRAEGVYQALFSGLGTRLAWVLTVLVAT